MAVEVMTPVVIGVGVDTARYGHHATFLRSDLQPAAANLTFAESAEGYAELEARLRAIAERHPSTTFRFRLDVAGAYADNLLAFLHRLPWPQVISCGEPLRNKNYRTAVFGHKKSDPVDSAAVARFAVTEAPKATPAVPAAVGLLRQIAARLDAQSRHCTRVINQLHHLMARVFPELALVAHDLSAGWVLALLRRYPTAAKLAAAKPAALQAIPYLQHEWIPPLQTHATASIGSLIGPVAEQLVRDQVRQVRDARVRHKTLEKLLISAYRALPAPNHLDSIKGIGEVTAAVLTARMVSIDRFVRAEAVVAYFGIYPVEASSGVDRDGRPKAPKRYIMSSRGDDLVRRYLYTAALCAAQHNPAVKPLYQRVRAKHPAHPSIAVGHAMRKLLHLLFAVWKTGKTFDPAHYHWETPAHVPTNPQPAAGHNPVAEPEKSVVTAAGALTLANSTATPQAPASQPWLDFAHIKQHLPIAKVLEHLGAMDALRGTAAQRRGPCPIHGGGRTFSVNLTDNVYQCFTAKCGSKGDVIDLWAAVKKLSLRDAALQLVQVFHLEPAPSPGTEKRNG